VLGKLIKFDFKTQWQFFAFLFGGAILIPTLTFHATINASDMAQEIFRTLVAIFTVGTVIIVTLIFAAKPFERDFNNNGAYLMQTIPVRTVDMIISKALLYYVWNVLAIVVSVIAVGLSTMDFSFIEEFAEMAARALETGRELGVEYEMSYFIDLGLSILSTLLQPLAFFGFIISAMATGHLFGARRKLGEFLFVIGFIVASSFYGGIVLTIGVADFMADIDINAALYDALEYVDFVVRLAVIAGFYIYTHYVYTKKINVL
jgi:hypothetical protein